MGAKLVPYFGGGYSIGGVLMYLGNLILVPYVGLNYFLAIIAGINISCIFIVYCCLPHHGYELESIINHIIGTYYNRGSTIGPYI